MTRPRSVLGAPLGSSAMAATTDRRARPWPHEGTLRGLSVILAFALLVAAAAAAVTSVRDALGRNGQPEAEVSDGRLWSQDPVVRRLAGYVERARGLRFLRSVPVVRMDGATLRARMSSGSLLDLADAQRPTATLRALGLITSRSAVAPSGSLGDAVGYYDITSKQVYVRKDLTPPLLGFVLVHELTHALQDQHFDLSRTYGDNADAALAAISLVEGDAERLARSYLQTLTPSAIDEVQREAPTRPDELYRGIYHESADEFPYVAGEAFARALLEHGGQAQLDAAFGSYPTSTEQVLHPERYLSGDQPLAVTEPPAEGSVLERGVLGEFDLVSVLQSGGVDVSTATRAGEGWGGARYVTWLSRGRACARVRLVMDTPPDTARVRAALAQWIARRPGGVSLRVGGPLTLTACERG